MNYYIADIHFGHQNVLQYDGRPFNTIEENDTIIIKNWNKAVGVDDDVYILGDVSWYPSIKTTRIFNSLNGNLHLIKGNHDNKVLKYYKFRDRFMEICDYKEIYDGENFLVLCHYPIPCFNKHYYDKAFHFYGHVHNSWEESCVQDMIKVLKDKSINCNMFNVGCMMPYINYTPRTFDEIISSQK